MSTETNSVKTNKGKPSKTSTKKNVARKTAKKNTETVVNVTKNTKSESTPALVDQTAMSEATQQATGTKGILVRLECHFPTNKDRRDKQATDDFRKESHTVSQQIMKMFDASKGKLVNYPEWDAVTKWKNKFNAVKAKFTLGLTFRGVDLVSVHTLELLQNEIDALMAELPAIVNALVAKLPEMKESDKTRLGEYYDEERYPTEEAMNSWGIRFLKAPLDTDLFPENAEFLEEANRERYNRLVESFSQMVNAVNDYIDGNKRSFRNNSIENLVAECEFLSECEIVEDSKIKELCEVCKKIGNGIASDAIRDSKAAIDKAKEGEDVTEHRQLLDTTRDALQNSLDKLKNECEGIL